MIPSVAPTTATRIRCLGVLLLAAAIGFGPARGVRAEPPRPRILRGVTVAPGREWTVIDIHLGIDARVLSHSPPRRGRSLQVSIRPESDAGSLERRGELIEWRQRDIVGLVDVELDGDSAGNPQLTLDFDRLMEFEVVQGRALDRVRVSVRPAPATDDSRERLGGGLQAAPPERRADRAAPAREPDEIDEIVAEGRVAMTNGDQARAILLFTKAAADPDHPMAPEARELLGLAYERNGKLAHAHAEYQAYLDMYPDSVGAPRVRQRLQALVTLRTGSRAQAPRPASRDDSFRHSYSGSLSQFYRSDILETDSSGSETTNSSLDNDVYLSSRHTRRDLSVRTNFAGSYRSDLLDAIDAADAIRVTSAFVDTAWGEGQRSVRLGRQSASTAGVLGRFDGVAFGAPLGQRVRANLVSGFPVEFTESNRVNTARPFYGLSLDSGVFWEYFDGQVFGIQQWLDGLEDRRAVGGQLRFVHPNGFGVALVDYDLSYQTVNTAMALGNWRLSDRTSVNFLADHRVSPILTTLNALQGQAVDDLDELHETLSQEEIRQLAEDRSAFSRIYTLGASHSINQIWQVTGDVTLSNLSETEASGGVPASEGTGNELFYSLRTSASNLLMEGSFSTVDLRYADSSTGHRYSVGLSGRYPIIRRLRFGPQVVAELRHNDDGTEQRKLRTALRIDYRWRRLTLEGEAGVEWSEGDALSSGDQRDLFFTLGYRYSF